MYVWITVCDLFGFLCVFRCHRTHADNHRSLEHAGALALDVGLVHGNIAALRDMAHFNAGFHKRLLKGEAAANQECNRIFFPIRRNICHLIDFHAVTVNEIFRDVRHDARAFAHIVDIRCALYDFQDWARFRVLSCKFFKIIGVLFRQDNQICLCISGTHASRRAGNLASPNQFPYFRWCHFAVICHIRSLHIFRCI